MMLEILFAGDFEAEFAECVTHASKIYSAEFVADFDIVIANNYIKPSEACVTLGT